MARSGRNDTKRLSEVEQVELEALRKTVARLNEKGRVHTIYHRQLAKLEARAQDTKPDKSAAEPTVEDMIASLVEEE